MRILILPATLLLVGCGSFTSFQSARALDLMVGTAEIQVANVALSGGTQGCLRLNAGMGRGFEIGLETDLLSSELSEEGNKHIGWFLPSLKYEFLRQTDDSDDMPVSVAASFAAGWGFKTQLYYGQLTASRWMEPYEPFFAWRYQRIQVLLDLDDPDNEDVLDLSAMGKILEETDDRRVGLHHFFLGTKIHITGTFAIVPEVSWILGDADGIGSIGISFLFAVK